MKNMGKKIRYIAFFIGVCVLLAGCGKKFDASGYTKAVLDVSYKNEIQKYVELTGADEKEADKIFEDNLQNNMDIMLQEFSGYELPDELEEKYRKLFSDMMKQVKYTVAEAKEVENKNFTVDVKVEPMLIFNDTYQEEKYRKLFSDMMKQVKYTVAEAKEVENKNFTVDVKVEPMLIFNDTYQELQKQTEDYATQVSNEVMNGASLPSETDMQTHVFEIYHDILRNYLDQGMKYGDPETITVHVNKEMNGASLPSETDMQTHVFEIYHDILRNYLDQGMKYGDPETITVHVNKDDKNVYTIADEDISKIDGKVMEMDVIEQ